MNREPTSPRTGITFYEVATWTIVAGWCLIVVSLFLPCVRTGTDLPGAVCMLWGIISIPFVLEWIFTDKFLAVAVLLGDIANIGAVTCTFLRILSAGRCRIASQASSALVGVCVLNLFVAPAFLPTTRQPNVGAVYSGYYLWLAGLLAIGFGEAVLATGGTMVATINSKE